MDKLTLPSSRWEQSGSGFLHAASVPPTKYYNKCLVYILKSVTPSKLFTTDGHFPMQVRIRKKTPNLGCFIAYQPQSDSAVSVNFSLIILPRLQSLLRKLARIACFKPYLPWCLRVASSHSSALQLQAKPQLEGVVAEGRCLGCSGHCSAGTSSRVWVAGEGSLLSHGRFVFWSSPVEPKSWFTAAWSSGGRSTVVSLLRPWRKG